MRSALILLALTISVSPQGRRPASAPQQIRVTINDKGFQPASLRLKPNLPARIIFVRATKDGCANSVVIPDYRIQRDLPYAKPVTVDFIPKIGTFGFACGMNMFQGKILVLEQ